MNDKEKALDGTPDAKVSNWKSTIDTGNQIEVSN